MLWCASWSPFRIFLILSAARRIYCYWWLTGPQHFYPPTSTVTPDLSSPPPAGNCFAAQRCLHKPPTGISGQAVTGQAGSHLSGTTVQRPNPLPQFKPLPKNHSSSLEPPVGLAEVLAARTWSHFSPLPNLASLTLIKVLFPRTLLNNYHMQI